MPLPCVAGSARVAQGPAGPPFAAQRRAEPPRSEQRACAAASPGERGFQSAAAAPVPRPAPGAPCRLLRGPQSQTRGAADN